ncbi:hypothetical protein [Bacterioplanoides sp.]|uniref:hypothetical protein n=1 Tax=Bacterioplanoides sp. TaxID=2066072 RepID=UPI003B5C5B9B
MTEQALQVEIVLSQLVAEILPDEILQIEAQVSVVSPDQIVLLEHIRQDSTAARDLSEQYRDEARSAASDADSSRALAGQYRDESEVLNGSTGELYQATDSLHSDTMLRHEEVKTLQASTQALKQNACECADSAESARDRAVAAETKSAESAAESLTSQQAAKASETTASEAEQNSLKAATASETSAVHSAESEAQAKRWATETENTPVQDNDYSALHWAAVAERIAAGITNGMVFAGSWNLADDLPPEPEGTTVPWYRISNADISAIRPTTIAIEALAQDANAGDQLLWDPENKEWFVLDTSDQVWLVNGQQGEVILTAADVGAQPTEYPHFRKTITLSNSAAAVLRFQDTSSEENKDWTIVTHGTGFSIRKDGTSGGSSSYPFNLSILSESVQFYGNEAYHTGNKPTAADVGAVSTTGNNTITGNLIISNGENFQYFKAMRGDTDAIFGNGLTAATMTCRQDGEEIGVLTLKDKLRVKEKGDSSYRRVYHEGNKPTPEALSVLSDTGGDVKGYINITGLSDRQYRITHPSSEYTGEFAVTTSAVLIRRLDSEGNKRSIGILNDGDAVVFDGAWRKIYHENFKPTAADTGAVSTIGNSQISDINSMILNGGSTYSRIRITNTNSKCGDDEGIAYLQAGFSGGENTGGQPGALRLTGWYGGFLKDCCFYITEPDKLKVSVSGSWHVVYHEGYKPKPSDIGALGNSGNQKITDGSLTATDLIGRLNQKSGYQKLYRYSESTHGSPDFEGGYLQSYLTFTGIEGCCTWMFSVRSDELGAETPQIPVELSLGGKRVYHQGFKPTAEDVGAEPVLDSDRKRKITISTSDPSGGSDGDIWFKV